MDNNNALQNNLETHKNNDSMDGQTLINNQATNANGINGINGINLDPQPLQKPSKNKTVLIILSSIVLVCIAIIIPVIILNNYNTPSEPEPILPTPAKQQSDNYHIEEYNGKEYYVIDGGYSGEYDLQTGYFESEEPDQSDNYWDSINKQVDEFNTQKVLTYNEYKDFCQKWGLAQKYKDQNKNYVTVAYSSIGSAYIDVDLANVFIESSTAQLYLYDKTNGLVADAAYYALFVPVDRSVVQLDIIPLITEEELQNIKNYGTTFDPNNVREDKPIIYLYPTTDAKISVKLGYPDKLTTVYPTYDDGWRVLAHPDGTLQDLKTGRELYSLYYESKAVIDFDHTSEGFVVQGKDSASFLEDKLEILGLTPREAEEFIVYWLPKLESSPYNFIRFATAEEIDTNMPLSITPSPDSIIRVLMVFKPLQSPIEVTEQQLNAPARNGFTVVEWGGVELSNSLMH